MDISEFKKLQSVQMEIMDEVHRICCKNNITYYIIGGTALGAIRHSGFIPWDVDIDIAMPRKDYEKFAEVCNTDLADRFIYRDYKNTKNFTHPHALVCIKNTFLSLKYADFNLNEENLGIYIDIFPLDKAPEDTALQQKQISNLRRIRKILDLKRAYRYKNDIKYTLVKKAISVMIFWISRYKLNDEYDKECRRYENTDSTLLCSMSSQYKYSKQCMPSSVYGTPQLIKFENREYYAPEMLDNYLTRIYGDYMKLPPEEERQANLSLVKKVVFDR